MNTGRLKPWNSIQAICEVCGHKAMYKVTAGGLSHVVCEDHYGPTSDRLCDEMGVVMGEPLKDPWKYWFYCTPIGRPFGRVSIAVHNWRFMRDSDAQIRRSLVCDHVWQGQTWSWTCTECKVAALSEEKPADGPWSR